MTTTPTEWALAFGATALLIPIVGWVLGPTGRRDGLLFTGAYLTAVFGIRGLWEVVHDGPGHTRWLMLALFFAWTLRPRWRAAGQARPAA